MSKQAYFHISASLCSRMACLPNTFIASTCRKKVALEKLKRRREQRKMKREQRKNNKDQEWKIARKQGANGENVKGSGSKAPPNRAPTCAVLWLGWFTKPLPGIVRLFPFSYQNWVWLFVFSLLRYNSGTYNNQYMVIDLKKIELRKNIQDGALWVIEQVSCYRNVQSQQA